MREREREWERYERERVSWGEREGAKEKSPRRKELEPMFCMVRCK